MRPAQNIQAAAAPWLPSPFPHEISSQLCSRLLSASFGSWLSSAMPKAGPGAAFVPPGCVLAVLDAFWLPCWDGEQHRNTPGLWLGLTCGVFSRGKGNKTQIRLNPGGRKRTEICISLSSLISGSEDQQGSRIAATPAPCRAVPARGKDLFGEGLGAPGALRSHSCPMLSSEKQKPSLEAGELNLLPRAQPAAAPRSARPGPSWASTKFCL